MAGFLGVAPYANLDGQYTCLLFFAGEVFPTPQLRRLRRALPGVRLYNLFGPTKTNVCTSYEVADIPDEATAPIPIGRLGSLARDEPAVSTT